MINLNTFSEYEDAFSQGWEEGRMAGYSEGFSDAVEHSQNRINALWADMHLLNARVDYLNSVLDKNDGLL